MSGRGGGRGGRAGRGGGAAGGRGGGRDAGRSGGRAQGGTGRGGGRAGAAGGRGGRGQDARGKAGGRGAAAKGGARGRQTGGRAGRGGRGSKKMPGGAKVQIEEHRHPGMFIARGKEDALVTRNLTPGETVYGEKRVSVEQGKNDGSGTSEKVEYRVWNPFRSKLAAGILGGLDELHIGPGNKVLYLGAASGTTVSHVSDIVGAEGTVYAIEFSQRSGRDLVNMAKRRTNIIPIIEDARHPARYRMLLAMVDTIFADVAQPDQARIIGLNAQHFLKAGGHFVASIKANCIDSTVPAEAAFAREVNKLKEQNLKPSEQLTLEPYERCAYSCPSGCEPV